MSVFTDVYTDDITIVNKVNGFAVDWENIVYTTDLPDNTSLTPEFTSVNVNGVTIESNGDTPYTLTLPETQGAAGDTLVNDGSGGMTWVQPVSNDVTTISTNTVLSNYDPNNIIIEAVDNIAIDLPDGLILKTFTLVVKSIGDGKTVTLQTNTSIDNDTKTSIVLTKKNQKINLKSFGYGIWYTV
jgi:hypothetical protein